MQLSFSQQALATAVHELSEPGGGADVDAIIDRAFEVLDIRGTPRNRDADAAWGGMQDEITELIGFGVVVVSHLPDESPQPATISFTDLGWALAEATATTTPVI
ncbi:MAG: hypothetical protein U0Q07_13990 [Acidimicrobiales bacterium]